MENYIVLGLPKFEELGGYETLQYDATQYKTIYLQYNTFIRSFVTRTRPGLPVRAAVELLPGRPQGGRPGREPLHSQHKHVIGV